MPLEQILSLIANTGFPIVVASYMILRMEDKLEMLNNSILELSHSIEKSMG